MSTPDLRIHTANDAPIQHEGDCVLYWMTAQRRCAWNFGLQRAAEQARALGRPLVIFEGLRVGHRWASDRLHHFVIAGMRDNARSCARAGVTYFPWVERRPGEGQGLLAALAERACLVVTDEYPCFFLPRMVAAAGRALPVRLEQVDSNGLMPLRAADRVFTTAASFRRHLQKTLPAHLGDQPEADPLAGGWPAPYRLPASITDRWQPVDLSGDLKALLAHLPIDHAVGVVDHLPGGREAALARAQSFLRHRLPLYAEGRNDPDHDVSSGLSPWLHFGHISPHEIVQRIFELEDWTPDRLGKVTGSRAGWWGLSPAAEAFLDELITWREVGFTLAFQRPDDYDRFESLPDWALKTIAEHAEDVRPHLYDLETLDAGRTHDPLWNAAQGQLRVEGRIHNYLRMLWGKKILEWSPHPRVALEVLIELNNRYALDGRDPNSYSGIFWTLGRFDRAWGPVRPIFGKLRYMSSENTARKVRVKQYIERYGAPAVE